MILSTRAELSHREEWDPQRSAFATRREYRLQANHGCSRPCITRALDLFGLCVFHFAVARFENSTCRLMVLAFSSPPSLLSLNLSPCRRLLRNRRCCRLLPFSHPLSLCSRHEERPSLLGSLLPLIWTPSIRPHLRSYCDCRPHSLLTGLQPPLLCTSNQVPNILYNSFLESYTAYTRLDIPC